MFFYGLEWNREIVSINKLFRFDTRSFLFSVHRWTNYNSHLSLGQAYHCSDTVYIDSFYIKALAPKSVANLEEWITHSDLARLLPYPMQKLGIYFVGFIGIIYLPFPGDQWKKLISASLFSRTDQKCLTHSFLKFLILMSFLSSCIISKLLQLIWATFWKSAFSHLFSDALILSYSHKAIILSTTNTPPRNISE